MHTSPTASSPEPATPSSPRSLTEPQPRPARPRTQASNIHKRRRRAPSPSRWVPNSLRGFILEELQRAASVPLPPVVPSAYEERNSWDENVGMAPYHPREWAFKPQLPGPGMGTYAFGGRDVRNISGGSREQMLGRLIVF
ncbi:hypothetical protein BDP27DRAFT_1440563 [Rhodocollybia butyracea]|nr:hypothetical protein BDP27DRAFT_1440563 [Rhodocollybia butyracea]